MILASSPDRNTFSLKRYQELLLEDPNDQNAKQMIEVYANSEKMQEERLADPEYQKNNLEYDLRSTQWVIDKVRESRVYAQHLYAAMCNNDFYKPSDNEQERIIQVLKDDYPTWSGSWRYVGGIVAHLRGAGDYIDWYCSGIRSSTDEDDEHFRNLSREAQEEYLESKAFVPESMVTDEIREDLAKLGWYVTET